MIGDKGFKVLALALVCVLLATSLIGCGPTPEPTEPPVEPTEAPPVEPEPTEVVEPPAEAIKIVVIGKSVHPYWSNVEKGVIAAGNDLGVETVFFVPPKEDVAAQTQTMETYIAQGVTGIAIAPSDPNALESVMKKAADAGIFVTTLDTPPVEDSVSLVYIGTDNFSAGKIAGETMAGLLPGGGTVGIGRGSDTALNALQRTDGFLEGIAGTDIEPLEPVNDKEDAATALQLANSVISANPDLAGAFGVYAYNGPAWATAIKEAGLVGEVKLVCFDATTDIINGIKEGVIDATVAQREYDMGYKSVEIIKLMAEQGVDAALSEMGAVDGIIDTGVDVITPATLKDYEAGLDAKGIPHEWDTEGWEPPAEPEVVEPAEPEETSIVIAIPEDPAGFNGHVSDTGYEQLLMELALVGLTDLDPEGNLFLELAAELPTVENGGVVLDEEAWTMDVTWNLRDDVYWADGEQVTAEDVIFTWDAITDPESGIWVDAIAYTESLEQVDDLSFTVHYSTTYPNYAMHFGGESFAVWPEHYCDASQGYVAWDCNREPLSTGPYLLEEWVTGDHISFVRNPDYYEEGKPNIDNIVVRIVPERAVIKTMMIEGDADVYMWLTPTEIDELKEVPHVGVTFSPSTRWLMRLIPNLAARGELDPEANPHPILSDVSVRRAIRMAIDTDTLTNEIFRGYNEPMWTELFRPPYVCDNIPKPEYDPEGAKALLEDAGWIDQDGDGIRECHGCATGAEEGYVMSMENMIYAEYGEELELAQQLVAEMLKEIGIELELSIIEGTVLWADYESGGVEQVGDFDLNMWDDGYPGVDPTDHLWVYYYSSAAEPDWGWNVGRWYNEDFDALLDEAYTLDEEYRKELFCQMAEILDQELPQIILWTEVDADGYNMRVEGVQATINDVMTWNVADWKIVE